MKLLILMNNRLMCPRDDNALLSDDQPFSCVLAQPMNDWATSHYRLRATTGKSNISIPKDASSSIVDTAATLGSV